MSSTLRYHTQGGHVPLWDGELWTCADTGCSFPPSKDDAAARLHYWNATKHPSPFIVLTEEDILGELESTTQR